MGAVRFRPMPLSIILVLWKGNIMEYTAVFTRVAHAEAFAARLGDPGMWVADVARKGRTVTFVDDYPTEHVIELNPFRTEGEAEFVTTNPDADTSDVERWYDRAEMVGYYGSPPEGPVATLNGRRTPRSY